MERETLAAAGVLARSTNAWGLEVVIDFRGAPLERVADRARIERFARELVSRLDMRAYGEPQTPHFGHADPRTAGITLVQLIETSSIVMHFSEAEGAGYGNVFSCRPFDPDVIAALVRETFQPTELRCVTTPRGAWRLRPKEDA